jgi:hypothetical protein
MRDMGVPLEVLVQNFLILHRERVVPIKKPGLAECNQSDLAIDYADTDHIFRALKPKKGDSSSLLDNKLYVDGPGYDSSNHPPGC